MRFGQRLIPMPQLRGRCLPLPLWRSCGADARRKISRRAVYRKTLPVLVGVVELVPCVIHQQVADLGPTRCEDALL
eukprot:7112566-Pyramimonas_sp.AAC.1